MIIKDDYESWADIVRSGQMEPEEVVGLMQDDPEFAAWYKEKYGIDK